MNTRSDKESSQIKVYMNSDGSVHKEIGPVRIESLVFEGGGIRGMGYIGATRALFETDIMPGIKRVAGTSAGAVTAFVIALGYKQDDIERLLKKNNMSELMESDSLFTPAKLSKLFKYGYFNEGDKLLAEGRRISKDRVTELIFNYRSANANNQAKLDELENLHLNLERVTFQDFRNLSRLMPEAGIKDLYIIASKLPEGRHDAAEVEIFSADQNAGVEVALAVRASISIPVLFKPVEIDGMKYIDGGCIKNYPIDIFDGITYKPVEAYMSTGNNNQNYSTLGIKIDTEEEYMHLLHAPAKKLPLKNKLFDKMFDHISGLPIYHSYKMNHHAVRNHYSHQSCQLSDEGIKTTQFDLSEEGSTQLIQRGYEDMKLWIENYYECAIESRIFSSYEIMCENMSMDELETFCDAMMKRPQDIIQISDDDETLPPKEQINKLQDSARKILKEKTATHEIIRSDLPVLNEILRKYGTDLVTIYSRLTTQHEVSEAAMWAKAAEEAVKIMLASLKNNLDKKEDVMIVTKFIDKIKNCGLAECPRGIGLFHTSRKMDRFSLPDKDEDRTSLAP